jgi:hypothetical protein
MHPDAPYFSILLCLTPDDLYKENFDYYKEKNIRGISTFRALRLELGPSLETSKFSLYFSGCCIPTDESLLVLLVRPTRVLAQTVQLYKL